MKERPLKTYHVYVPVMHSKGYTVKARSKAEAKRKVDCGHDDVEEIDGMWVEWWGKANKVIEEATGADGGEG